MDKIIWLDSASTTKPKFFAKDYAQYWPNPNSNHALGLQANQALNKARQRIMDCLGVKSGKVLVGGTASQLVDNLMWRINESESLIVGSNYEHSSIDKWIDFHLNSFTNRNIRQNDVVCWMMVNNITGKVFDIKEIGKLIQEAGGYYIVDAVAAIGHYPLPTNLETFCDCIITSAHKYGGPQGIGCMWVSDRFADFLGLLDDSHEEYGLIHGTPNVSAAVAMSYAMEHAVDGLEDSNDEHWRSLLGYLETKLLGNRIECDVIAKDKPKIYAINAIYLPKFNADALVNFLSSKGIYISPGHSACSNNTKNSTRVLEAFGLTKEQAGQTIRISFGENTSQEEIDALVQGIVEFKNLFV